MSGLGAPQYFDFTATPPEPEWVVNGMIERGTVVLLAGDSTAGKSLVTLGLCVAILRGERWLERQTDGARVLVLDNENSPRLVDKRLRMIGLTNDERERLRYYCRSGVQLGAGKWMERTLETVEEFKPDLIVLDTVSSTTNVVINDNDSIVNLYATMLRPLAGTDRAVLIQHHERKPSEQYGRSARHSSLGGVHWKTQADTMLTLERKGEMERSGAVKSYPIELQLLKDRDGGEFTLPLSIKSDLGSLWFERRQVSGA